MPGAGGVHQPIAPDHIEHRAGHGVEDVGVLALDPSEVVTDLFAESGGGVRASGAGGSIT
jgi:hypothetical protein